jgi:hypothetical protein
MGVIHRCSGLSSGTLLALSRPEALALSSGRRDRQKVPHVDNSCLLMAALLRPIDPARRCLKSARPELGEGRAGFDRLSPNGVDTSSRRINN